MDLGGTVALVAGASGDIGRAISFELLEAGAEVLMLGRSLPRLLAPLPPEARRSHCRHLALDLTAPGAAARVVAKLAPERRLDVLVLSVGVYERSDDPAVFERQMTANVIAPYALLQHLLPLLVEARGQVVVVNSSQALKAGGGVGQYAATKHAQKALTDSLREEINALGVRVASLYVGRTAGARQREIFAAEGRPYPPERLIQPADIGRLVRFLLQQPRNVEVTDIVLRPMLKT